jgi:hypothetical protein
MLKNIISVILLIQQLENKNIANFLSFRLSLLKSKRNFQNGEGPTLNELIIHFLLLRFDCYDSILSLNYNLLIEI